MSLHLPLLLLFQKGVARVQNKFETLNVRERLLPNLLINFFFKEKNFLPFSFFERKGQIFAPPFNCFSFLKHSMLSLINERFFSYRKTMAFS
jgi:hypothetical protein